jgi:hypothetical protein
MEYNMRTDAYIMTAFTECAGSMLEIENIKTAVKSINKLNKLKERYAKSSFENGYSVKTPQKLPRYRVTLHGRGPRAEFAKSLGRHSRAFDRELPLKFAERIDVYIHER